MDNYENYDNQIKKRIKQIRHEHSYSQKQVVIRNGWTLDTYKRIERNIENGGLRITAKHLKNLCKIYGLNSADFFLFGKPYKKEN